MFHRSILLLIVTLIVAVSCNYTIAQEVSLGSRAHVSTLQLRDEIFNNTSMTFTFNSVTKRDGFVILNQTGKLQFARFGTSFMADSQQLFTETWSDDHSQKFPDRAENEQKQMSEGRRCFSILYELQSKQKFIRNVACNHQAPYDNALHGLCNKVYLSDILTKFGALKQSLIELTRSEPAASKQQTNGNFTVEYSAEFGTLEISASRQVIFDRIQRVRLVQNAENLWGDPV